MCYNVTAEPEWCVVIDGEIQANFEAFDFVFSSDSKHLAYSAIDADKLFVMVDGKAGKKYDDIESGTPVLSPDGNRTAYGAMIGKKWCMVVDGKEDNQYDGLGKKVQCSVLIANM